MRENDLARPAVTVATIVVRDNTFLCVEEETRHGLRLNQPAGHLEPGETLVAAAVRETLEETAYSVEPVALVGIYRWQMPGTFSTFVRFSFLAEVVLHDPGRKLDRGIVRTHWLDYATLAARRHEHRSPLVMRCFDDYIAGTRLPLSLLTEMS
ncbi:MAG: NUDIX hydrolase [Pseudomonadota bacterium]|nr:NUDIX hydrolase [Pseudomonadota bacterium]